jgi:hypothetical protein
MKNLFKIGALGIAILGCANVAGAQVNKSADVNATATVLTDVSVSGTDFTFGNVYRSSPSVSVVAASAAAGHFDVVGTPSTSPSVSFVADPNLKNGVATLPISFAYASVTGTAGCATAGSFANVVDLDATGKGRICVGGTVSPTASTQTLGSYTGKVTITVAFP